MPNDGFYSQPAWYRIRTKALMRDGYTCRMCKANIRGKGLAHVDHIIGRRKRPDLALSIDNLQSLCMPCHNSTKQVIEKNADKPAIGMDGFPSGSEWA
jgi:5-methylcytosine-specific restriction protein A